jgi:hypothetical protein
VTSWAAGRSRWGCDPPPRPRRRSTAPAPSRHPPSEGVHDALR